MLLLAFFLEFTRSKHHVNSSLLRTKPTLAFREETLLKVLEKVVEQDMGKNLPSYGQKGNASVIVTRLAGTFPFINVKER